DFLDRQEASVIVDSFEIQAPPLLFERPADALGELRVAAETFGEEGAALFLEVPVEGDAAVLANLLHAIAEANGAHHGLRCALKFRCGGLTAPDVPPADALAA